MRLVLAQEARSLIERLGFRKSWIRALPIYFLLLGVFGVFIPLQRGRDFLDSVILGAYACLGVVFAAPAAAAAFDQRPSLQQAGARVAISVIYGEIVAGAMLLLGLITVYASHAGRIVVGPNLQSLAECLTLGFTLSLAVCMAAVWLCVKFSPTISRGVVRAVFLALVGAFFLRSGWLPSVAVSAAEIALLASLLFFLVLRATL
jgi:hypothetical protein